VQKWFQKDVSKAEKLTRKLVFCEILEII